METLSNPADHAESDFLSVIAQEDRPPPPDRPWVLLNMVASVDGAAVGPDGRSASLSGPADHALFHALRAIADVILAGAETVRTENYGTPRLDPVARELRAARRQAPLPRLAVPTVSLHLDPMARLFREMPPEARPIVLTSTDSLEEAEPAHVARLRLVSEVRAVGRRTVDWVPALRLLREEFDTRVLLVEGGPSVNGQLVTEGLIDELRLTVSPQIDGGRTLRIVAGAELATPMPLSLDWAIEADGFLLLRYLRGD